jgi:hypothetical protein
MVSAPFFPFRLCVSVDISSIPTMYNVHYWISPLYRLKKRTRSNSIYAVRIHPFFMLPRLVLSTIVLPISSLILPLPPNTTSIPQSHTLPTINLKSDPLFLHYSNCQPLCCAACRPMGFLLCLSK